MVEAPVQDMETTGINQGDIIVAVPQVVIGEVEVSRVVIAIEWDQADPVIAVPAVSQDMEAGQVAIGVEAVTNVAAVVAIQDTQMISI
jgi:hypothetical protein